MMLKHNFLIGDADHQMSVSCVLVGWLLNSFWAKFTNPLSAEGRRNAPKWKVQHVRIFSFFVAYIWYNFGWVTFT